MKIDGWLILEKNPGITSAHAVAKVKRILRPDKIGHAGTLDPLASGVLPLALGEATKTVAFMMDAAKAYSFTVTWGEERDTDDIQGKPTRTSANRPTAEEILAILPQFIGEIEQTPPNYSAIKVDGERAYDLAREGKELELKSRKVRMDSLIPSPSGERLGWGQGDITVQNNALLPTSSLVREEVTSFLCHCGKGTYIRSLARDMGRLLGCYGHISVLRRLKVGKFTEKEAISLEKLEEMVHKDGGFLQPVESALDDILALEIDSNQAMLLKHGQTIPVERQVEQCSTEAVLAKLDGKPVAICSLSQGLMKPVRVFNL